MQKIFDMDTQALDAYIKGTGARKILLVCGSSAAKLRIGEYFESLKGRAGIEVVKFSDFHPNPGYYSVQAGVELFKKKKCDMVAAIGGGSAMDVAKCIKMYVTMDDSTEYIKQEIIPNDIEFLAVPTTAGTGSEATRYAIIYYKGEKISVTDNSCIPTAVVFDPTVLETLPIYHKKATMLDALCHSIESYWSTASTEESRKFAADAIKLIFEAKDEYLAGTAKGHEDMLRAAFIAGEAINITGTTVGHAMCYKLTTKYSIAHGHATALVNRSLFPYMLENLDKCHDPRGREYLDEMFGGLAAAMGCDSAHSAAEKFYQLTEKLEMSVPVPENDDLDILINSVNTQRLKSTPVSLDVGDIEKLYRIILFNS